jgi:rubrerythrin
MSIQFDAETIFEIGIQIEKNGRAFYLEAAKKSVDQTIAAFFTELADWEKGHIVLFETLKAELPDTMRDDTLFDPENEMAAYLQAAADSHVFAASIDVVNLVAQCHTSVEALDLALRFEKDSVVYYTTLKQVVADHRGKDQIETLIQEELNHIVILNKKKNQFR